MIPQKKINRDDDKKNDFDLSEKRERENITVDEIVKNKESAKEGLLEVEIGKILANPYQPRTNFDEEKLKELANSIKEHGILQPMVVTRKGEDYELIAGERRLQAAKIAMLEKVPVIVKDVKDKEKLELAIVENIQRHNLDPLEEAKSFQQLADEFQMSQDEVAQKMGKSRSVVSNKIRLLKLPVEAIKALKSGTITEGHAKAILSLENPEKQRALLDLIIRNHLTVRQAEDKTKEISVKTQRRSSNVDPVIKELEDRLATVMGTKVRVTRSGGEGGKIIIDYYSNDELNSIIDNLSVENKNASRTIADEDIFQKAEKENFLQKDEGENSKEESDGMEKEIAGVNFGKIENVDKDPSFNEIEMEREFDDENKKPETIAKKDISDIKGDESEELFLQKS